MARFSLKIQGRGGGIFACEGGLKFGLASRTIIQLLPHPLGTYCNPPLFV